MINKFLTTDITGESCVYSTVSEIYAFVPVNEYVFGGGCGVWEVILRYSNLYIDNGMLTGSKIWRITPVVNWYISANVRLEFVYMYGVLDSINLVGTTQFFRTKIILCFNY